MRIPVQPWHHGRPDIGQTLTRLRAVDQGPEFARCQAPEFAAGEAEVDSGNGPEPEPILFSGKGP